MKHVKVAIIGAGTAGLNAQSIVSKYTDDYVVIDDGILGTTCARVGCMPSKVFIQVANDYHRRKVFQSQGIHGAENLSINTEEVMTHVRKLRDRFVRSVFVDINTWKNTHLIQKRAVFLDKNTLDLGDEKITAENIIIATGSSPIIPKEWLPYKDFFVDTNSFFEIKSLPKSMAVIGLGVIGIEIGQALNRLTSNVIGITRRRAIGGFSDPELINYSIQKISEEMKLDFGGVQSLSSENNKLLIHTKDNTFTVDKALISIGRSPNVQNMGLEKIGIELNEYHVPIFNSKTLQIENTNIFIAGDVNEVRPILHETADEGTIAGYNAVHATEGRFKRRTWLGITFADPNFATVGMRYESLQKQNVAFETGQVCFEGQGRAIVMLKEVGLLNIYGCKKTNKILGAELFAPSGEHLAHLIAWSISQELTVHEMLAFPFYHPVVEESLRSALRDLAAKLDKRSDTKPSLEMALCKEHLTSKCAD